MIPGDLVGDRFELVDVAGEGGMGVVWRARDRATGAGVALKVLRDASAPDARRFTREASVLRGLSHEGIVAYLASGALASGDEWLAMEWIEGCDLRERLGRGRLSIEDTVALGIAVADALAALHAAGLVHRDLKPGNVRLEGSDPARAKLLDFGVVRLVDDDDRSMEITVQGALVGTPGYMSPEQARGSAAVDARSDLFSLGAVLYACICGVPAFRGATLMATLAKVILEDPPSLRSRRSECPRALERLVLSLLAKSPAERPASAADVVDALRSLRRAVATTPEGVPVVQGLKSREQRWVSVLMVSGIAPADDAVEAAEHTRADATAPLMAVVVSSGARAEWLRNGALVLVWSGGGSAEDVARGAARATLRIAELFADAACALAAGRATVDEALPVGDAVDLAASVLRSAAAREVRVDAAMARLVEGEFVVERDARGARLSGVRTSHEGVRTLLGKPTPCVGRDVELAMLDGAFQECADGSAVAVTVTGEPGVGKSRVVHEWLRRLQADPRDASVWRATADALHQGAAFVIAADLVRSASDVRFGASREQVRASLGAFVARVVAEPDRDRVASRLCELCGAPWESGVDAALAAARSEPVVLGDQLRAAWEDLLVAASRERPVVLVVDNLAFADAPSLSLIDRALRNFQGHAFMVVGVGRPDLRARHPGLWGDRGVRDIKVGPLRRPSAEALIHAVLGARVNGAKVAAIVSRAAGNAYWLEELIRAESEGRGGETPETVLSMVEARLLGLDPDARRTLRAASVLGARFDAAGVAAVIGDDDPSSTMQQLADREWLVQISGGGFAFRSETSREAAYAMLLDEDKALAHGRAAAWLAEQPDADGVAVADHFERASMETSAAEWWARAATRALEANELHACLQHASSAERCRARGQVLAAALIARIEALGWLAEPKQQFDAAQQLVAEAGGDPDLEAYAARSMASAAARMGETALVAEELSRMAARLVRHPESDAIVQASLRSALIGLHVGLVHEATALAETARGVSRSVAPRGPAMRALEQQWIASRALFAHDAETCVKHMAIAADLYGVAGDVRRAADCRGNVGFALLALGANVEAIAAFEASIAEGSRLGLVSTVANTQQNLGLALSRAGRHEEGLRAEQASITSFVGGGNKYMQCGSRIYASRILVASGRAGEAVAEATEAASLLAAAHPWTMMARAALAEALLARAEPGDVDCALEHSRAARAALREDPTQIDEPALILRVHLDALEANGLHDDATRERKEAQAWVLSRAAKIQSDHYRHTFLCDEPDNARIMGHR